MGPKKKGAGELASQEANFDDLLDEFGGEPVGVEMHDVKDEDEEEGETSKKTEKNRMRKEKKKAKAKEKVSSLGEGESPTGKKKETSVVARLAQERMVQAEKEAELRRLAELEEVEEELALQREEEAALATRNAEMAVKREKREGKKLRKEQMRKEGKAVTRVEKDREERLRLFRQQLEAQGLIGGGVPPISSSSGVVISRRSGRKKQLLEAAATSNCKQEEEGANRPAEDELGEEVLSSVPSDWEQACCVDTSNGLLSTSSRESLQKNYVADELSESSSGGDEENIVKPEKKNKGQSWIPKSFPSKPGRLRSPICCILGHVDTGKTKLLDKIRHTNVQLGEAGGITQQIGATFFPREALLEQCRKVENGCKLEVPGLLIIDTPGHESFNNLRARGSSLCDIAILVVDIMHGLEPQTIESLTLLKARKCPFVIALNKIDRLYQWKEISFGSSKESLEQQNDSVKAEFDTRNAQSMLALQEQGLNGCLYWLNKDDRKYVSAVPTSAHTGEGIPDLLSLIVRLTQGMLESSITYKEELRCTILEVKNIEGLGITIDVILINGTLHSGDIIVVCGRTGPIVTKIRALLTPQPLKELRIKGEYVKHKQISAAMGVKISANKLDDAISGTALLVYDASDPKHPLEVLKEDVMEDISDIFKSVDRSGVGVHVMASTLGSLEALLMFLKGSKIHVASLNLGTVFKSDVKKASIMIERGKPEFATILAFDVKVDPEAQIEADQLGVKLMTAEIIYHLYDQFTKFMAEVTENKKKLLAGRAVFPSILRILPNCVFNKKDPIVVGVIVEDGVLRKDTPLCVPSKEFVPIGRVVSIEHQKKDVTVAKKGMEVAIKIVGDASLNVGRQFGPEDKLVSRITRDSIDCLKEVFRDDMTQPDWELIVKLKKVFSIP